MFREGKEMSVKQMSWIREIVQTVEMQVLVLLSDGFDDDPLLPFIIELRKASQPVSLIGLSKKEVRSVQGIVLQPDLSLDDVNTVETGSMLIIPDGRQIHSRIKTDPRVHNLVAAMLSKRNLVVAVPQVVYALRQVLTTNSSRLITWQYQPTL